ncbi:hypothetical protein HDA32_004716 [Spinactinospora alkalitolerans]|uniref:Uncharacterized protein n=1 Tax=Spinactinospora alkalitolerans TaxID=687207 RepID=A0A852TYG6_9ACTN|nr:hypothetical protein [Spinactinospora alkalitolerans]NYE49596.1 hypothetical protein [Spinactinospora alkalitolerans]
MLDELARLMAIQDPAERLQEATRLLIELDEVSLRVAQVRNECRVLLAGNDSAPPAPEAPNLTENAQAVLDWIHRQRINSFTQREAFRRLPRTRFRSVDVLIEALEILEASGRIVRRDAAPQNRPGRPASPVFEVRRR